MYKLKSSLIALLLVCSNSLSCEAASIKKRDWK